MPHPFFPGALFGWTFYVVLVAITVIASYTDVRRMIVPKWLTVPALVLGILMNTLRGGWLGASGDAGFGLGAWDGFLFSMKGFGVGFGLFFAMWVCGVCRGGDVKLFAALGAWVGMTVSILVLMGTVVIVTVFALVRWVWRTIMNDPAQMASGAKGTARAPLSKKEYEETKRMRRRMVYSPALAMSTAFLVFWQVYRDVAVPAPTPAAQPVAEERS